MASALDLTSGDPELAEKIAERQAKGQAQSKATRAAKKGTTTSSSRSTVAERAESHLRERIELVLSRIAEQLELREDEELATVIREDSKAMTNGLVSLTRTVKWLRRPLLVFLGFVEPVLAFGRVGRILFGRWQQWRYDRYMEAQAEQNGTEPVTV